MDRNFFKQDNTPRTLLCKLEKRRDDKFLDSRERRDITEPVSK